MAVTAAVSRMAPLAKSSDDTAVRISVDILRRLTAGYTPIDWSFRFWDGSAWSPAAIDSPCFTVVLHHPGALRRMFWHRTAVTLGEAYIAGDFSIEGDLESSFRLADHLTRRSMSIRDQLWTARDLLKLPSKPFVDIGWAAADVEGARHSRLRDRRAVTYHYDTSNVFFATWLDPAMVYSCAYFEDERERLELAQRRKLDYICRKLRLQPSERLLDIGCGWGGLVIHAAKAFGANAVGITLSEPQALLARAKARGADISRSCRIDILDYRDFPRRDEFDKIASIGMVEHVGVANLPRYFEIVWQLLRPGGVFLLHGITETPQSKASAGPSFADRYVFPDSELPEIGELLRGAERSGFEIRDVENLREHYLLTLRCWRERLERNRATAVRAAGAAAYELWRLFMAGAAYRFRIGQYNLYQILLVKPAGGTTELPLTRADWYV